MEAATAALIGAGLATGGWLYTARRQRALSRKQHTVNVMLQASFSKDFRDSLEVIGVAWKASDKCPDLELPENAELRRSMRFVTNHFEFIAAGIRNGDFDEKLVRDSLRGVMLRVYEFFGERIWHLRKSRRSQTTYEHIEWLYTRWERRPPGLIRQALERLAQRPFPGKRVDPHG